MSAGRRGKGPRFCAAPAAPGSSYCPAHRALCQVAPDSAAAAPLRAALRRAADRTEFAPPHRAAVALPEPPEPFEPDDADVLAGLGLVFGRGEAE